MPSNESRKRQVRPCSSQSLGTAGSGSHGTPGRPGLVAWSATAENDQSALRSEGLSAGLERLPIPFHIATKLDEKRFQLILKGDDAPLRSRSEPKFGAPAICSANAAPVAPNISPDKGRALDDVRKAGVQYWGRR